MTEYALYLESGPRQRKTMAHVLDLLGRTAQGPTTEAALEATPNAIRAYLCFLHHRGEPAEPGDAFATPIATHITDGAWLSNGDPSPRFAPDSQPLAAEDLGIYLRRAALLQAGLLELIRDLSPERLAAEAASEGRSVFHILAHVAEADAVVDCWGGRVVMAPEELTPKQPVAPIEYTPDLPCPLLGLFGEEDRSPTPEQVALHEQELKKHGKAYEFHMYPKAGHGFFYHDRPAYRQEQAVEGWNRIFAFLGKYLA